MLTTILKKSSAVILPSGDIVFDAPAVSIGFFGAGGVSFSPSPVVGYSGAGGVAMSASPVVDYHGAIGPGGIMAMSADTSFGNYEGGGDYLYDGGPFFPIYGYGGAGFHGFNSPAPVLNYGGRWAGTLGQTEVVAPNIVVAYESYSLSGGMASVAPLAEVDYTGAGRVEMESGKQRTSYSGFFDHPAHLAVVAKKPRYSCIGRVDNVGQVAFVTHRPKADYSGIPVSIGAIDFRVPSPRCSHGGYINHTNEMAFGTKRVKVLYTGDATIQYDVLRYSRGEIR